MNSSFFISLKLADRSFYPLYRPGEWGSKSLNLAAVKEGQDKMELVFFLESDEEEAQPLLEIALNREQLPDSQWTDILLKTELSREGGLVVTLLSKGEQLDVQQSALPLSEEDDGFTEEMEVKQDKRFSITFSLVSAAVLFCLSLSAAFFMGNILSSPPPPDLTNDAHQEYITHPLR